MQRYPISFIVLVLLLGLFIGSVAGSLVHQVFGFDWLDIAIFGEPIRVEDFYLIRRLDLQLTPASLLGVAITGWVLYRKMRYNEG